MTEPQDSVVSSATDVSTVRDGRAPQSSYDERFGGAAVWEAARLFYGRVSAGTVAGV